MFYVLLFWLKYVFYRSQQGSKSAALQGVWQHAFWTSGFSYVGCSAPVEKRLDTAGGLWAPWQGSWLVEEKLLTINDDLSCLSRWAFSQEEMEEMLSAAIDPESNSINYKDYITMMVIDEN